MHKWLRVAVRAALGYHHVKLVELSGRLRMWQASQREATEHKVSKFFDNGVNNINGNDGQNSFEVHISKNLAIIGQDGHFALTLIIDFDVRSR